MTTIKDVAKLAGVSISTVSYTLNNSPRISASTKKRVEEAAKALNYKKNGFASDLKRSKTNTIALLLSDLSGPYYSELIQGVQDITTSNGYDLIACSSIGGAQSTAVKFLSEKRVDGAVILAHNISDETMLESAKSVPIVLLDRILDEEHIYLVEVDNIEGGYHATEYLIDRGHSQIAFVSGPADSHDSSFRYQGYRNALEDHHIDYQSKWYITSNFTKEGGYRATKLLIAQQGLPQAIFYANDEMAIGGMEAFRETNLRVPEDISIIGYDDIQLADYTSPPLTTIRQPKYEAGSLAAHLIFQLIAGEKIDRHYKLSTEIIERQTVKDLNTFS